MQRCLALTTYANIKPTKSASCLTLFLEALNPNRSTYFIFRHSSLGSQGLPTLHPLSFKELSMYKSHVEVGHGAADNSPTTRLRS